MAMTGAGLAAARKAAVSAVTPYQGGDPVAAASFADAVRTADSTAIVQYIQANAAVSVVTTGNASTQSCTNGTVA